MSMPESKTLTKAQRAEMIAERVEAAKRAYTYWLTRDYKDGVLSDQCSVWVARPTFARAPNGDVTWSAAHPTGESAFFAFWTLDEAFSQVRFGYPQTDRESVRVGPEPEAPQLQAVPV